MTYYQKYRPQKIEELDLVGVRGSLLEAIKSGNLAHAYLFVGPRGSGKTSAARILAAAVNCTGRKGTGLGEPCGKCDVCKGVRKGSEIDVLEMDAASHRGIDDIRNLKEKIKLSPVKLVKKIYIIDEVHMLTKEAFNALLKVLEEPPLHVMFFLCTTEEHKVPETIISRCAKLRFTKATEKEVEASLMKVVKGEKLKIDKEAVSFLARSIDGSFREGHKLLQQLGNSKVKITEEEVKKMLGLAGIDDVVELLKMSLEGRFGEIGGVLSDLERKGVGAGNLLESLLRSLQEMIRVGVADGDEIGSKVKLAGFLIGSAAQLKVSPLPFLPIELALLEVGLKTRSNEPLKKEVVMESKPVVTKPKEVLKKVVKELKQEVKQEVKKEVKKMGNNSLSMVKIEEEWGKFLETISVKNRSVAGLLRASKPKVADGNNLTVEVFYEFHKSQLEQDSKRMLIEQAAGELWGPTILRCVLGEKQVQKPEKAVDRVIEMPKEDEYVKSAEDVFGN